MRGYKHFRPSLIFRGEAEFWVPLLLNILGKAVNICYRQIITKVQKKFITLSKGCEKIWHFKTNFFLTLKMFLNRTLECQNYFFLIETFFYRKSNLDVLRVKIWPPVPNFGSICKVAFTLAVSKQKKNAKTDKTWFCVLPTPTLKLLMAALKFETKAYFF